MHHIFRNKKQRWENLFLSGKDCVALRYLVTGDAQDTIAANYRMSRAVVGRIINETCTGIWDEFINKGYLDHPKSEHD